MSSFNLVLKPNRFDFISTQVDSFGVYVVFTSIKAHFKSKWDFSKGVLPKLIRDKFMRSYRAPAFQHISSSLNSRDIIQGKLWEHINFMDDSYSSMEINESSKSFVRYTSSNKAIETDIMNMMQYIKMKQIPFSNLLSGKEPTIIKMYSKGYITFGTIIAMDCIANILKSYRGSDILLQEHVDHLLLVKKLFTVDTQALKLLLKYCKDNV